MMWQNSPHLVMEYFCRITCLIFWGINNDLLILNMDLTNIVVNSSIMWRFKVKRKYKGAYYHSRCNQCSKYLKLLLYFQYFQNCWNDEKQHAWKIFNEFKLINILALQQRCVVMARCYGILQNKTIYMKTHYDCQWVYYK
jgi:hypothetical protein